MTRSNVKSGRQDLVRRRAEPGRALLRGEERESEREREGTAKEQRCFSFAPMDRETETESERASEQLGLASGKAFFTSLSVRPSVRRHARLTLPATATATDSQTA